MTTNITTLDKAVFGSSSIFTGVAVYEHIDPRDLFNVIHTAKLIELDGRRYENGLGKLYKTEKDLLLHYQYQWNHPLNCFVSNWSIKPYGWGRTLPDDHMSMSVFHRPTRHTLCDKYLVDLDIINCHYEIVLNYMKRLQISCVEIEKYCINTKKYRALVAKHYGITLEQAKSLFIRLIYGGGVSKWKEDNKIDTNIKDYNMLFKMKKELIEFQKIVIAGNQHIADDILSWCPTYFDNGYEGKRDKTLMSFWCNSIERYIQEKCIMFLVDKYDLRLNNFIPCQDGFMMLKTDYNNNIVDEINQFIYESLGFQIRMKDKEFDEKYKIGVPDVKHVFMPFDLTTAEDAQYAQYLIDVIIGYSDIMTTGNNKHMESFVYNRVYWEQGSLHNAEMHKGRMDKLQVWCNGKFLHIIKTIQNDPRYINCVDDDKERAIKIKEINIIIRDLTRNNAKYKIMGNYDGDVAKNDEKIIELKKEICDLNEKNISDTVKFKKLLSNCLISYRKGLNEIGKLSRNSTREAVSKIYLAKVHVTDVEWDADPNLFAFKNAIMDLRTGEMVKPCKEQFIKTTCNWEWNYNYDTTKVDDIRLLIESILPVRVVRDYYLLFNATGLTGHKVQRVPINTGTGGNGKSLCRELMSGVVGGYGMKIPADILTKPLNSSSPNPFIANMDMKRSLHFAEPDDGQQINSSTLKDLSGERTITGRGLYSSNTSVNLIASLAGDCNTIPGFTNVTHESSNALLRRIIIIYFPTTAVTQEIYDSLLDKTNYNVKKNYAEDKSWLDDNRQAVFLLLLDYAKEFIACPGLIDNIPQECIDRNIKHISASSITVSWFEDIFELADESGYEEVMPFRQIYKLFKDGDVFKRLNKAEKRTYKEEFFKQELLKSASIKKGCIKYRDDYHDDKKLNVDYTLIGYRMKV